MENPLEVQRALYGEDGPPMVFIPEASALHLEMRAPPRPSKRAKLNVKNPQRTEKRVMTAAEIFTKMRDSNSSLSTEPNGGGMGSRKQLSACQLPGDFPPELSFRTLAAYSLLRTLSVQLRLSPFTPNAFLRALYLPAPNRLLGEVHVALLRILFVQKLKNMGYSYKSGGGGVGATKRRQIDNIRWQLLAGDNLTHLDAHSWPLFYDDYCHLTADRLWASYHGPLDGDGDDTHDNQNFIDFRNIGVFSPPKGKEYQTKLHSDGVKLPTPTPSSNQKEICEHRKTKFDKRISNLIKTENIEIEKNTGQFPFSIPSGDINDDRTDLSKSIAMLNSDDSDSGDEYQEGDDVTEGWRKLNPKKRRRTSKKNNSSKSNSQYHATTATTTIGVKHAVKEKTKSTVPSDWSRITSLESSIPTPVEIPTQKRTKISLPSSAPSWSRISSMEPSFSSPLWSPRRQSIEYTPRPKSSQSQVLSSFLKPDSIRLGEDPYRSLQRSLESTTVAIPTHNEKERDSAAISMNRDLGNSCNETGGYIKSETGHLSNHFEHKNDSSEIEAKSSESYRSDLTQKTVAGGSSIAMKEIKSEISSESGRIHSESIVKSRHDDQLRKKIQFSSETQTRTQEEVLGDTDIMESKSPSRIRGGGFVDDIKFKTPSNSDSIRPKMGRPRGSRRALPMHNSSSHSPTLSFPSHAQNISMLQLRQQMQHNSCFPTQLHQNFGVSHSIPINYPLSNLNSDDNSRDTRYHLPLNVVSNQKLRIENLTKPKEHHVQDQDLPFVVPNEIAETLNAFVGGSSNYEQVEYLEGNRDNNDRTESERVKVDLDFERELEMNRWLHFKPLKAMRSGLPYHRLPSEDKVCILEFLLDELLTVDSISSEFTKRRSRADDRESPYGILPNENEFQNLENNDECVVCGQEGDLLCCDGCVSSYHGCCLGMKVGQDLPEGKWLCPECSIVDPCNYGSLHGGRKESLDWFTLDDITNISNAQHQHSHLVSPGPSLKMPGVFPVSHVLSTMQNPTIGKPFSDSVGGSTINAITQSQKFGNLQKWKKAQFMVVHGFVFCKDSTTTANSTFDIVKSSNPSLALPQAELEELFSNMNGKLSQVWPFSQIPSSSSTSWKVSSTKNYFASSESIDPFLYDNKYHRAPVSAICKVGAIHNMTKFMYMTYESECNKPITSKISGVLTDDFSFDSEISTCLNTSTSLFDPYQFLAGYMIRLEHTLKRSCMLNEFWEGGQFKSRGETWIARVREAKSIRALSRLLLKLVNAMHARAFSSSWYHSHVSRSSDLDTSISERNYKTLPTDWSEEKEKNKRKWETTPSSMILKLCTDYDNDLMGFASKIRSDIFIAKQINVKKSKRKLRKAASSTKSILPKNDYERTASHSVETKTHEQGLNPKVGNSERQSLVLCNQNDPKLVDSGFPATAEFAIGKEKVEQVCQESVAPPVISESLAIPGFQTVKQKANHDNLKPLRQSKGKQDITNASIPTRSPCIGEEKKIDLRDSLKTTENTTCVQGKAFKTLQEPGFSPEHERPANIPKFDAENKANQEMITKPLATCEGNAETTKDRILTDSEKGATASKSPKKKKRKKPTKPNAREPSTRRRTRHSGRLLSGRSVENSNGVVASGLQESSESDILEGMALQVENAKKKKIPGLEKLLKGQYAVQGNWPIAGRKIFPTVGNISPNEMKRIARNAGSTVAVNLSYHTNHEVAQVCYGHIWRKRVELCNRFEELLFLMRVLESSLDRGMIQQCENQTRRGKNNLQKVIRCSVRNSFSGNLEHFLVNKKSLKGCWVPAEQLDLSSLILDLFCRRQSQKEQRLTRVRAKESAEKEKIEKERSRRIAEAAQKTKEEKMRKEEARRLAKLKKQEDAAMKKREQETKKQARLLMSQKPVNLQQNKKQSTARNTEIDQWTKQRDLAFFSHERQVQYALESWTNRGLASLPENAIIEIRKQTMQKLMIILDRLRKCNVAVINNQQILTRMFHHEKQAVSKVQPKKTNIGTGSNNTQNMDLASCTTAGTGIPGNISSMPYSTTSNKYAHGNKSNLFSAANSTPSTPNQPSSAFNNGRKRRVGENSVSPQPIVTNHQFATPGSSNYFSAKKDDLQLSPRQGGIMNQTFNMHPQKCATDFQNQFQNSTPPYYPVPGTRNIPSVGASSGGSSNTLSNMQQYPLQNHPASSTSQPLDHSRSLPSLEQSQQLMKKHPASTIQIQHQRNHNGFYDQQSMQSTPLNTTKNLEQSRPHGKNYQYMSGQDEQGSTSFNRETQKDINQKQSNQHQPGTGLISDDFNQSNRNHTATNGSTGNIWNPQNPATHQFITFDRHNQNQFFGQGNVQQHPRTSSISNVMHDSSSSCGSYGNPNSNHMNSGSQSGNFGNSNSNHNSGSHSGNFGKSNSNHLSSGSQPGSYDNYSGFQSSNYGDFNSSHMNSGSQPFSKTPQTYDRTQPHGGMNQQDESFSRHLNYRQPRANDRKRQQTLSMTPQHQQRAPFRGQQQYSSSQHSQQQQDQIKSIQNQIFLLQQQQQQQQQQQNQQSMQRGQHNAESKSFY